MRDLRASTLVSHSQGARTAVPLLDSSDEDDLGRDERGLGVVHGDTDGALRDDGLGYERTSVRRHQLRSRSPGTVSRLVDLSELKLVVRSQVGVESWS